MNSHLYLLSFVLLLSCCKKDDDNGMQIFEGSVKDYENSDPVDGAEVQLIKADGIDLANPSNLFVNPSYFYSTTNANGNFQVEAPADSKKIYVIKASKPGFICVLLDTARIIPSEKVISTGYAYVDKPSIVTIVFHDTVPSSLNDSVKLTASYFSSPHSSRYLNIAISHTGSVSYNGIITFSDTLPGTIFQYGGMKWMAVNHVDGAVIRNKEESISMIRYKTTTINYFF